MYCHFEAFASLILACLMGRPEGRPCPILLTDAEEAADAHNETADLTLGVHQNLVDIPNLWLSAP
jgi:hypothetical protein